ncbi:class I SAM-dependent methyltransferase [Microvirga sp. TS319]|uniref:class I SAM-dependent methyltransferase n=1 Tax=Microvirga sp. TS319 TaxID=3241165 RepID=UPI003519F488
MRERDIDPAYRTTEADKSLALIDVIKACTNAPVTKALVVGCGSGREAGLIARGLEANTVGIDIGGDFDFDYAGSKPAELMIMDARELHFPARSFDFIFSFHALEHIPRPEQALAEMARVLKPGGSYLIGTPNKSRLVGYVGSAASFKEKFQWNLDDYKQRLKGKWSNEAGAHAGFTQQELFDMCSTAFGRNPIAVSSEYYSKLYGKFATWMKLTQLDSVLYPCVYVFGKRA